MWGRTGSGWMDELVRRRAWEDMRSLCFLPPHLRPSRGARHCESPGEEVGDTWPSSSPFLSSVGWAWLCPWIH